MIVLRVGGEEILLEPEEWRRWVEDGRVPPDAWVLLPGETWVRTGSLPIYRALAPGAATGSRSALAGLRDILFPRRGLSATEILILVNILVAAVLTLRLGAGYEPALRAWAADRWHAVAADKHLWWWIPTLFLHAGPEHLASNMVALLVTAGATEFLVGRPRTLLLYLSTGICGAALSYYGHGGPPLSIGASGAVYGLAGAAISLVLRHRRVLSYRQRWKAWRVYFPLFLVLALPSVLHADYWAHGGGLLGGLLLGLVVPPHPRVRALDDEEDALAVDEAREPV